MHTPNLPIPRQVVALGIAVVVAACSTSGGQAGNATVSITTPGNGTQVSVPFDVALQSSVPIGSPETGNHHIHLYYDTDTNAADYDIVYGLSWHVTRQLSPGQHKITAALANPDHSLAGPTTSITVNVTGGGGSGPASASPAASSSPGSIYGHGYGSGG